MHKIRRHEGCSSRLVFDLQIESARVSFVYMPSITITLSTEAHERLKKHKGPRDSFSDVVLREVPEVPLETCGQLENYYKSHGVPKADPKLRAAMLTGRGRRSKRTAILR